MPSPSLSRWRPWIIGAMLAGAVIFGFPAPPYFEASAQIDPIWRVRGKLLGEPVGPNVLDSKKAEDISGIACATDSGSPRLCIIADDESQGAQIVILGDGEMRAGSFIRLIANDFAGELLELDAEGVAYADGAFYVVGSHGRPRHRDAGTEAQRAQSDARAAATRQFFRIRLPAGSVDMATGTLTGAAEITPAPSPALNALIQANARLAPFFDRPLADNGLTIEGIAVLGERLYIGMRGPVLDGAAVMLVAPLASLFPAQGTTAGSSATVASLGSVDLGRDSQGQARGIRDLLAYRGRLLILAGPAQDPADDRVRPGDYSIYAHQDGGTPRLLLNLPGFPDKTKPEAMLPLVETNGELQLLLLFDGPDEGAPRPIRLRLN